MEIKNQLAVFDPLKAEVEKWKEVNESISFEYETPEGEKAARSHIFKLRGTKSKIAAIHKEAKAEALAHCRAVDGEKNYLIEEVDSMIMVHQKPINAIAMQKRFAEQAKLNAEKIEKERIEQERLDAITKQEEEIADRLAAIAEKEAVAKKAEEDRLAALVAEENRMAADRAKFEAEKKAEADARKREAEAKRQAEINAEFEKKEALEKAEAEKQAAIDAEKEKARKLEAERVAKIEAEKVEQKRLADIAAKKIADKKYRKAIEESIATAFEEIAMADNTLDASVSVMEAIRDGKINHVTINY